MRTIRFRIWDKAEYNWIEPKYASLYTEFDKDNKWNFSVGAVADSGIIISEFTGLNDDESKPIYEGDIVEFYDEVVGYCKGEICFEAGMFIIACDQLEDSYIGLNEFANSEGWCDNVRVKGNIYQNPELIKEKE